MKAFKTTTMKDYYSNSYRLQKVTETYFKDLFKNQLLPKVERAINSGAIDPDYWDERNEDMILPKCIVIAILEDVADNCKTNNKTIKRQMNREIKNLKLFI